MVESQLPQAGILLDLLGCEGYNEWFTVDLPGDENSLSAAAPWSFKDSLEKENDTVCETAPLSLEDFQNYFAAIVQDETVVIQDVAYSGKALTVSTGISSEGVHRKFAEPKTDEEVSQAREFAIPAKTRQDTAYCV